MSQTERNLLEDGWQNIGGGQFVLRYDDGPFRDQIYLVARSIRQAVDFQVRLNRGERIPTNVSDY